MPIYEYKCTECDERFEIEQSIHDEALTSLAGESHEHTLKKVFSPIGIAFKGSGFYKNDARGSKSSSKTAGGASPSTSSTSSDSTSSDSASSGSTSTSTSDSATKSTPAASPTPSAASPSSSSD